MNTDDVPTVSVVIPTFNRKDYLAQAIDSVLAQRDAPLLEVIVSDNASDDGTQALMARYAAASSERGRDELELPMETTPHPSLHVVAAH